MKKPSVSVYLATAINRQIWTATVVVAVVTWPSPLPLLLDHWISLQHHGYMGFVAR